MQDLKCLSVALWVAQHHCQALSKLIEAMTDSPTTPAVARSVSSNITKQVPSRTL
jgi:hypothetical protein